MLKLQRVVFIASYSVTVLNWYKIILNFTTSRIHYRKKSNDVIFRFHEKYRHRNCYSFRILNHNNYIKYTSAVRLCIMLQVKILIIIFPFNILLSTKNICFFFSENKKNSNYIFINHRNNIFSGLVLYIIVWHILYDTII